MGAGTVAAGENPLEVEEGGAVGNLRGVAGRVPRITSVELTYQAHRDRTLHGQVQTPEPVRRLA
jgi:hypothetical protein